jgi:putative AlgH/UPF0301 family transcriptional regulator
MKRVLLWLSLTIAAAAAQAQTTGKPLMLVASPALQGLYSRTTLIAIAAAERHVGFIVNRATKLTLATLFPSHAPSAKVSADARFFAGFVGWQPGEPEKEIDAGYWHIMDPDGALFFRPDTTRLWEELIERLRFQSARI